MKRTFLLILIFLSHFIISGYLPEKNRVATPVSTYEASMNGFCSVFFSLLKSDVVKPDYEVFKKAFTGFLKLKAENNIKKNILTIIDFSLSSNLNRMWIIDINKMMVVHFNLVAHGRNSGEEYARNFSNIPSSQKSSLGFFLTDQTYTGKHGLSLILEGVEAGINDRARERAIVMHGADYVSTKFIHNYGRLGRSFGCPSIPPEDHEKIIRMLSGGSCIYIYYPDYNYLKSSRMFASETALKGVYSLLSESSAIFNSIPGIFPSALFF